MTTTTAAEPDNRTKAKSNILFGLVLVAGCTLGWFFLIPGNNPGVKPASDSELRSAMEQCPSLQAELAPRTFSISSWALQDKLDECLAIARQKAVIQNFKP